MYFWQYGTVFWVLNNKKRTPSDCFLAILSTEKKISSYKIKRMCMYNIIIINSIKIKHYYLPASCQQGF